MICVVPFSAPVRPCCSGTGCLPRPVARWTHDRLRPAPGPRDPRLDAPFQRQGPRCLHPRSRRPLGRTGRAARRRLGPHQRLRPHPGHSYPGQGQGADGSERLVVRAARRHHPQPPRQSRRPRSCCRPRDGVPSPDHVPRRVRGPRLPHRFGPGRIPREPVRVRHPPAGRAQGGLKARGSDLHPRREGRTRRP